MVTWPPDAPAPQLRAIIVLVALAMIVLEMIARRRRGASAYDLRESAASLGVALVRAPIRALEATILGAVFFFVYRYRLFDFDQTNWLSLAGLALASEFFYYWFHRASHRIRWLWATHAVHHSSQCLNLSAAVRLGWTGLLSGSFVSFVPLVWLGFHPLALAGVLGLNLLYQFFIHSSFAPRLGPVEWVLNTPAHHHVHHASNPECLDRNFGGVLIVFDRIFGTFGTGPSGEPLRYGLHGRAPTLNPIRIALGEWLVLLRDVRAAAGWRARFRLLFWPPRA